MTAVEQMRAQRITRERAGVRAGTTFWTAVALATLTGAIVRLLPVWSSDFPLNDGGMFYLMVREIQQDGYALPAFTAYNGGGIPFAYPPFGFYLAALLGDVTNVPLLDVVRLLPSVLALLTIPAFALLSGAILRSRAQAIIAVFAFALLPRTFIWLIMGGGLTRAPGALFAILTLWQVYLLYTRGERRYILPAALFGGLTVLSHAEWAWFTAYSVALIFLFWGRSRRCVVHSLLVAAGVVALTAPWWATVIARHGLAPLVAASQAGGSNWYSWASLLAFKFTSEAFLPILGVLGLVGLFACAAERSYLIPAWLVTILIVQPRSAPTLVTLPLAMLVAIALDGVILPGIQGLIPGQTQPDPHDTMRNPKAETPGYLRARAPRLFAAYCLAYTLISTASLPFTLSALRALPPSEREAMAWVVTNTPPGSTFLVLDRAGVEEIWQQDRTSEWFPVLAERVSLGTVQGTEWLPDGEFARHQERFTDLFSCVRADTTCLESWAREGGVAFTHVYIAKEQQPDGRQGSGCCDRLVQSLRVAQDYVVVYDGPGVAIFAHLGTPSQR